MNNVEFLSALGNRALSGVLGPRKVGKLQGMELRECQALGRTLLCLQSQLVFDGYIAASMYVYEDRAFMIAPFRETTAILRGSWFHSRPSLNDEKVGRPGTSELSPTEAASQTLAAGAGALEGGEWELVWVEHRWPVFERQQP
ncbi:hypothetical protein PG997_002754 [Apiospora hydei]|uniref:Uncharacterized protein n=1 Tax=Apiospora hydei TaxID=1337664 RepID=A0ABR1WXE1_9PEZI